ncbi:MAG: tRNA adenosine(34) deaminase TadA [Ornithinimicrobium sp.]
MRLAIEQASSAVESDDVPVGAVVVDSMGVVIGRGHNVREAAADPTGHAEILALREAGASAHTWRLAGCTLIVTLEPCAMCAGAAVLSRVDRVVFGAFDGKAGACGSVWDLTRDRSSLHRPEVVAGVLEQECQALLMEFFQARRLG